jgi:hypothetical protein
MISTSLTVFSVLQETMPVLPIHLGLLDQMGLEGDDEPSIMLIKKIPSDENRSESEVRGNPKLPPRCPQFQKQTKTPAKTEEAIPSTRKSSRQHKPSSWYSSDNYVLGSRKARETNPPQLVGFIPGDISPRISPNQLKKRKLASSESLIPAVAPTHVASTIHRDPPSSRYLFCLFGYFGAS